MIKWLLTTLGFIRKIPKVEGDGLSVADAIERINVECGLQLMEFDLHQVEGHWLIFIPNVVPEQWVMINRQTGEIRWG